MSQRNLKVARLAAAERRLLGADQLLGLFQNYLVEWIVEFQRRFEATDRPRSVVRHRSCNVGELLFQELSAFAI